jgi:cytochrome c oxidase cbb3-type subunit 1
MSTLVLPSAAAPSDATADYVTRIQIDRSCRQTVVGYYASAVAWLLLGSIAALISSVKLHHPEFLSGWEWITFGRIRPVHLNMVVYGWSSMVGIGTTLWLEARLCKVRLPYRTLLPATVLIWNAGMIWGVYEVLAGHSTGVEWLEFPPQVLGVFGFVLLVLFWVSLRIFNQRRVTHTYVSQWYLFGSVVWFPIIYTAAILLPTTGLVGGAAWATANWWYAHNVLGLYVTPMGLATIYYMIPKVTGKPIYSYHLSLLGFWTNALFYSWAGTHHLVGGPLPAWIITLGIVGSIMMFVPVTTVAINHHMTMVGKFRMLKTSPTLRFIVFGAMSYTVVSYQGSLEALRWVSHVAHFTHYTVAHAHLGMYAFYTMTMFGSMYYIMPRVTRNEWSSVRLIKTHFWTCALGILSYFFALSWGGWYQGVMMNNPLIPFIQIVDYTKPYLVARSISGTFMTIGHIAFAILVFRILRTSEVPIIGPTLFTTNRGAMRRSENGK